jgi:PHD/YefM family antitoxin component YafN of YafNO toxin-antitoxin module
MNFYAITESSLIMEKVLPTIPASILRQDQAGIFDKLSESPILLTHHGQAAGVLVHPDQWNELVDLLRDFEDAIIAQERLAEAKEDPSTVVDLDKARAELVAQGLLND